MYKILISDKLGQEGLDVLDQAQDVSYDVKTDLARDELLNILDQYDGWIVRSGTRPDKEMIEHATKLKVIGRAGMGVDNIDVNAATSKGVIVMNTPGANSMATAEQTLALMLAASRHTAHAHRSLAGGEWQRSKYVGQELYKKTLGIIGFGKIGRLVAARAQAFGMEVLAYDPYVSEDDARQYDVTLVDLDDLLAQSDIITLHTAATDETEKIINQETLAQMRSGVILVNVARGKLIDEQALLAALEDGKLAAAALDVYQQEPPADDNQLIGHPKVTHTPHLGASSVEAQRNVAVEIAEQVIDCLRGGEVRNAVNLPFEHGPNFAQLQPYLELAVKLGQLQYHIATGPIERVEIEVQGELLNDKIRPIAAALLQGMLLGRSDSVKLINAPLIADQLGIQIAQRHGLSEAEYPNFIACRVHWGDEQHIIAGTVHGGKHPRVVQFNRYYLEGNPTGIIMLMRNRDVPGVIGQIGTLLAAYNVNIGEWRLGRTEPGGEALSFINLDNMPPPQLVDAIRVIPAVVKAKIVTL